MSDKTQTLAETSTSQKSSRRAMLRLAVPAAAGVAALAAAGATEALRPGAVRAAPNANGDNLVIGNISQTGTSLTGLAMTSATGGTGAFEAVDESNAGQNSFGVAGVSFHNGGVYGLSGGGIVTPDDTIDKTLTGVYGHVHNGNGSGTAGTGYGVVAHANRGAAPLLLISTTGGTTNGFPKTAAADGAMNVDANGVLYSHRFGSWFGIPCMQFLTAPVRLLDARNGATSGLINRGPLGPNEIYALTVGGLSGSGIPTNAQGVIGNLTVLGPSSNGNISVFPDGAAIPTTASMTFGQPGLFLANSVTSGIGSSHKVDIQNQSNGTTPLVFDAVAFLI